MDTDERVRLSKSFAADKGSSVRPILSWRSRALMIAGQSFCDRVALVDAIVQHGADTCGGMHCPHDDNVTIAEELFPDVVVVTSTSTETIKRVLKSHTINIDKLVIINENDLAYSDELIGGKISTSSIIKRIKHGS